jgi:hypothetical protein
MSVAKAVWGTVIGGVILIPISWGLESIKEVLPTGLDWLGSSASLVWQWLSAPRQVPTFVVILALVVLARVSYETYTFVESTKARDAARVQSEKGKAARLSGEQEVVMEVLAHADGPVEINDLLELTKLSRLRLDHSLAKLRNMLYVRLGDQSWGVQVELLNAGRDYIVRNDIDKPPS